jgi:hypothetical protein
LLEGGEKPPDEAELEGRVRWAAGAMDGGWPLLATALRSPVVRNRNMALPALDQWGQEHWPPDANAPLDRAAAQEPDAGVRERMLRLIRGEPPEPDTKDRPT